MAVLAEPQQTIAVGGHSFHPVWLRDNCLCSECRHPTSFQKLVDLSELAPPRPRGVRLDADNLTIDWDERPDHRSMFPVDWLLAHAYDGQPSPAGEETLWDAASWSIRQLPTFDLSACDPDGGAWADDLMRHGFIVLANVTEPGHRTFAESIGPLYNTEFGQIIVQRSVPGTNDLVETGYALAPHTDYSAHTQTPPLLQFMFFLEHEATGGDTILVDGFKVAEDFRRDDPDGFDLLVRVPVSFQQFYTEWRLFHHRTRPIIEVDATERVAGVFFGHSHACNWSLHPHMVEPFYRAYFAFLTRLKDPAYQVLVRMQAGQCVAMRNGRLLHGRTAYDSASGARTVINAFVSWENFEARRRFHRRKHLYLTATTCDTAKQES